MHFYMYEILNGRRFADGFEIANTMTRLEIVRIKLCAFFLALCLLNSLETKTAHTKYKK